MVGEADGTAVGDGVGAAVGEADGVAVGDDVGAIVGEADGTAVGDGVGVMVGDAEGTAVGDDVDVGAAVGVGTAVGPGVGAAVGLRSVKMTFTELHPTISPQYAVPAKVDPIGSLSNGEGNQAMMLQLPSLSRSL